MADSQELCLFFICLGLNLKEIFKIAFWVDRLSVFAVTFFFWGLIIFFKLSIIQVESVAALNLAEVFWPKEHFVFGLPLELFGAQLVADVFYNNLIAFCTAIYHDIREMGPGYQMQDSFIVHFVKLQVNLSRLVVQLDVLVGEPYPLVLSSWRNHPKLELLSWSVRFVLFGQNNALVVLLERQQRQSFW